MNDEFNNIISTIIDNDFIKNKFNFQTLNFENVAFGDKDIKKFLEINKKEDIMSALDKILLSFTECESTIDRCANSLKKSAKNISENNKKICLALQNSNLNWQSVLPAPSSTKKEETSQEQQQQPSFMVIQSSKGELSAFVNEKCIKKITIE